jgi:hypothetical protein
MRKLITWMISILSMILSFSVKLIIKRPKLCILTLLFVIVFIPITYKYILTVDTLVATVTKTEGNKNTMYLVYTDVGTFKIVDDVFYLNFYSADMYGKLIPRKKYKLKVQGIRFGWLSWYRNIVKVTPLDKL